MGVVDRDGASFLAADHERPCKPIGAAGVIFYVPGP